MVPHARFCSECGTWVVGAAAAEPSPPSVVAASRMAPAAGGSRMPPAPSAVPPPLSALGPMPPAPVPLGLQPMPPPPPVAMPDAAPEYAGTLPASALSLGVLIALPDPLDRTEKTGAAPVRRPVGASTEIRTTIDTGRPPPPGPGGRDAAPGPVATLDEIPAASRAAKTIVDERPPVTPSRSMGRTPRPLGGFLVSYQYEPLGTFWPLAVGTNIVGRAGGSRADLDVGIADTTVSSEQALLDVDGPSVTVEDRGSRNGTQVNGRAIVPGVRVPIAQGDRVRFGSFETILVLVPYPSGA